MKTLALLLLVAACGGGSSNANNAVTKPVDPTDTAAETCCCKSIPMTSEDAKPAYETGNRMECSSKQGECVDEVQCQGSAQPE